MLNRLPALIVMFLLSLSLGVDAKTQPISGQNERAMVGVVKQPKIGQLAEKKGSVDINRRAVAKRSRQATNKSLLSQKIERAKNVSKAAKQGHILVYDAWKYLDVDSDGDGYYSEFTLGFDVDTSMSFADVYADIYISENGGPWFLLHSTEVFRVFGSETDAYELTFTLNQDFPSNDYDILIDIYENGFSGVVDTYSSDVDSDLWALPLEDLSHESVFELATIDYVATSLSGDLDGDGYYTELTIEYDITTQIVGDWVYAELVVTSRSDFSQQIINTESFTIDNQTEILDLSFDTGYLADGYDVEVNLISNVTGEVIASTRGSFGSLRNLPIESKNNDNYYDGPADDVVVVVESGGGSLNIFYGSLLLLIAVFRRFI